MVDVRNSPSGPLVTITGGGAVDSVQGSDGITPTTPQTGIVTLSGDALLPRDGSRPLTGNVDCDGFDIGNGTFNDVPLVATGPGTNFLADDGTYKAVSGGGGLRAHQTVGREFTTSLGPGVNVIQFSRFIAPYSISVTDLGFFIASASVSDSILFGLYSADLTTLIGEGNFTPSAAGWGRHALNAAAALTVGNEYWIAYKSTNNSSTCGLFTSLDTNQGQRRSLFNAGATLPANASGATPSDRAVSSYIYGSAT